MGIWTISLLLYTATAVGYAKPLEDNNIDQLSTLEPVLEIPEEQNASLEIDVFEQNLPFEDIGEAEYEGAERNAQCPVGWHQYGSLCYHFVNIAARWAQAERHCLGFGGNLASVHSLSQYQFLQRVIYRYTYGYPDTWIGANDAIQEGIWLWSDGSRYDFIFWSSGNPNNFGRQPGNDNTNGREHCMEMNWGGEKRWNDAPCWFERPFICSRKL